MYSRSDLHQWLNHRKQTVCHRQLVVLSGDEQWGIQTAKHIIQALELNINNQILTVGLPEFEIDIANKQYKRHLGQEFDAVIYNAWAGIRANTISAISGTIRNKGLMILLCPDFKSWPSFQDPELNQRLSFGYSDIFEKSLFIQWLIDHIQNDPEVCIITEESTQYRLSSPPLPTLTDDSIYPSITQDQSEAVEAIIKVATGHRGRPLVMQADRGRGKSAAIGIASAQLANEFGKKIILTAPHKDNCQQSFHHFKALSQINSHFCFWAADRLIDTKPEADLIVVDEAAALPVEMLKKICKLYRRIVFSTTIHGYEGSGRGFEIRFKQHLKKVFPESRQINLSTPIRWHEQDSLERFWFESLCYTPPTATSGISISDFTGILDKEALVKNKALLFSIFSLLIDAHYQTTPDTLASLLDSPEADVFVCIKDNKVLATAITMREGGKLLSEISALIVSGQRRPNGHLLAQKMGYLSGDSCYPLMSYLRIVRIAVSQNARRNGVGSCLLSEIKQWASAGDLQYVGASFGAEADLLHFWTKNGFSLVNLGHKKETATGEYNAIFLQPLNASLNNNIKLLRALFSRDFIHQLPFSFKAVTTEMVLALLQQFSSSDVIDAQQHKELELFASTNRGLDITGQAISSLALDYRIYNGLNEAQTALLISFSLQRQSAENLVLNGSIKGKKDLENKLREIIGLVLNSN